MPSVLDAFIKFIADTKDVEKAMGPGGKIDAAAGKGAAAGGKTFGAKFGTAAKNAVIGASAVGGVIFTGAIESGVKFEDQLRTINTVAKLSDLELGKVGDGIQEISRETGKSTDDLSAGFYDLVSAGVSAEDAIGVLRDSAKFATGALGTTAESVDLVTSVMNAYGLEATDSARITDVFAKAVADGKVTAAELGQSIAQIAPIASSAGVSMEEVASGFAFLTAKGVPASAAATQMRASISALLTPNEQLNRIQQQTGKNFAKIAEEKGLAVALEELRVATEGSASTLDKLSQVSAKDFPAALKKAQKELGLTNSDVEKFQKMAGKDGMVATINELSTIVGESDSGFAKALGSVDAYGFALSTTGQNAEAFQGQITNTMGAVGIAQEQYEEKSKSALEQGKRLTAQIDTFIQDLGGPFVGVLGPAVSALGDLGTGMLGLFPIAKGLGGVLGGVAGKALTGIGGLAGKMIPMLLGLIPQLAVAAGTVGSAVGGFIAAAIPIAMAALPFILIAALIAAIIFLINNPEIVAKIGEVIGGILNAIATFLGEVGLIFYNAFQRAVELVGLAVGAIVDFILGIPAKVAGFVGDVLRHFLAVHIRAAQAIGQMVTQVVGFILSIPGKVVAFVGGIIGHVNNLKNRFLAVVSSIVSNVVSFLFSIPGKLVALGGKIVTAIVNGLKSLPGKIWDIVTGAFRNLRIDVGPFHISAAGITVDMPNIQLPSFDVGSRFVPADMLAMVHQGEIIVPRHEADQIRQGHLSLGRPPGGGEEMGGGGEGGLTVQVFNPEPEPASTSVKRELQKRAVFGR